VRKPEGNTSRPLRRHRHRLEDNIKMKEIGWGSCGLERCDSG
jgi:hypothetical protein